MIAILDKFYCILPPQNSNPNNYSFGCIRVHNLVITCLPVGTTGIGPIAVVANNISCSFSIKISLIVGIREEVLSKKSNIYLGDITVSKPIGNHSGVV